MGAVGVGGAEVVTFRSGVWLDMGARFGFQVGYTGGYGDGTNIVTGIGTTPRGGAGMVGEVGETDMGGNRDVSGSIGDEA